MKHRTSLTLALVLNVLISCSRASAGKNGYNDADEYSDNHVAVKNKGNKEIVFFAGPHKSAATSVEKFFHKWAANGWQPRHPHTKALQYWRWPSVTDMIGNDLGFKVYGDWVKNTDDKTLEGHVLKAVKTKFDEAENGIFLGTEEFDQVGEDAIYDGLSIMKKIQIEVGVENKDVAVVLNYRSPRLDQWVSIWKHAEEEYKDSSYEDFMCNTHNKNDDKALRYSMIGAEMNLLNAALVFLQQGYRVIILDMGGLATQGKDVVHTIGCDVLVGACSNGMMGALGDYLPKANAMEKEFNELSDEESAKIETLFRHRDCAYKQPMEEYLNEGMLEILYQDTLWADCSESSDYYEKFKDNTAMMYNALLGQLQCKGNPHNLNVGEDMNAALKGPHGFSSSPGFFHVVFMPVVLLVAIGYGVYKVQTQVTSFSDASTEESATEMAPYPPSASDGGGGEADFRDDTALEDGMDLSDNVANPVSDDTHTLT